MRFSICALLCLSYAEVRATPCEDSIIYSGKSAECSHYMDSLDAQARTGRETGTEYRPKGDPANGYVLVGLGVALIAGGAAISHAGEKAAERCNEEDGILNICNDGQFLATPVLGLGILSLLFGVVSLSQAFGNE